MTAAVKAPGPGLRARRPEPAHRQSRQPVHRSSKLDGPWVEAWWRRMSWREKHELCNAARRYDRANKQPGEKSGPIGSIALELLEELATLAVGCHGRVYPTLGAMAAKIRRSRTTVVACLRRLADAGILAWVRRLVPKKGAQPWARGPQVEQTSNAYRLELPERLRRFVRKAPPAADEAARKAEMRRNLDAALREEARDRQEIGVQQALARGAAMKRAAEEAAERESSRRTETVQKSTSTRSKEGVRPAVGPIDE